jgi:site-specific recombinase XerD
VVQGAAKGRNAGAGPQYREVPHTDDSRRAIRDWLELRTILMREFGEEHDRPWLVLHPAATPNNPMLPSSPAGPMRLNALKAQLSTVGAWELHRFRHTCGTEWLRAGMELAHVSRLLGHANITQTLGYAEIVADDVHRSAMRAHDDFTTALRPERKAA